MSTAADQVRFRPLTDERTARDLEEEMLTRWRDEGLVARALERKPGASSYVFYDGPPTANGKPGIHHVFARTTKDLFARHRAMLGYWVPRKAGWDTHGLPVEIEVEKQLGISGKPQIEAIGVQQFNDLCRESVWRYKGDWERLVERIAHWLDYRDPYITYSKEYVESVWWALATLHGKDLLYRGHKILPYCPRCGTTLSSHEVAQGYEDVEDPSVYLALDLVEDASGSPVTASVDGPGAGAAAVAGMAAAPRGGRRRILVWTTTPWTLLSNVALAVSPTLSYVEVRKRRGAEWTLLLAESRVAAVLGADWSDRWDVVATHLGRDLAGLRYRRPLDWVPLPAEGKREVIVAEDFVSADDGSGVVHMAPAFGADDYAAGQRHGLAFVQPVNARGEFPEGTPEVGGMFVKAADATIIAALEARDVLWKAGKFLHSYPHCWRCRTPLLYYARTSWFIRTSAYKDRMLSRNGAVDWHPPEVGAGRFGEWLTNNVDWAVSRDRYWGTPLPVWVNDTNPDEMEVIGSYAALAAKAGRALPDDFDPHKPGVDSYTWPAPSGTGTMRRVSEVVDTWFDSGSMPFAQWHYPFENREAVAEQYPADFIAEGVDQTRGWFYSLLAIATGLGDALPNNGDVAAPYRSVVVNDLVLDAQGRKMSKSRGNTVDPWQVIETHGADAVRLFLIAAGQVWQPRLFDERAIRETIGGFFLTLRNVYRFFADLANFGWTPSALDPAPADRPVIDRWMLSRLATVEREVHASLMEYQATEAARRLMQFVADDVSNWYVRLNRDRFYDPATADSCAAFATLHEVLVVTTRLLAPLAPFASDWMHRELTGTSVHLASYLRADAGPTDVVLERAMDEVRALTRLGRAARESAGIKVRQPLARMVCVAPGLPKDLEGELLPYVASELNLKLVEVASSADALVTLEAKANFRTLGKKFGKSMPEAAAAVAALSSDALRAFEHGEALVISAGGTPHAIAAEDLLITRRATGDFVVQEDAGRFAAIDPAITPALRTEGLAREVVSRVQRLRKDSGLALSDRIVLYVQGDAAVEAAARVYEATITSDVLALTLTVGAMPPEVPFSTSADFDGLAVTLAFTRAD